MFQKSHICSKRYWKYPWKPPLWSCCHKKRSNGIPHNLSRIVGIWKIQMSTTYLRNWLWNVQFPAEASVRKMNWYNQNTEGIVFDYLWKAFKKTPWISHFCYLFVIQWPCLLNQLLKFQKLSSKFKKQKHIVQWIAKV